MTSVITTKGHIKNAIKECFAFSSMYNDYVDYFESNEITNIVYEHLNRIKNSVKDDQQAHAVLKEYLEDTMGGHLELIIPYTYIFYPNEISDDFTSYIDSYNFGSLGRARDYLPPEHDDSILVKSANKQ